VVSVQPLLERPRRRVDLDVQPAEPHVPVVRSTAFGDWLSLRLGGRCLLEPVAVVHAGTVACRACISPDSDAGQVGCR
jgi:hypothetical protein